MHTICRPIFFGNFHGREPNPIAELTAAETKPYFRQRLAPLLRVPVGPDGFSAVLRKIILVVYAESAESIAILDASELLRALTEQRMPDPTSRVISANQEKQVIETRKAVTTDVVILPSARGVYLQTLHRLDQILAYIHAYRSALGVFHKAPCGLINEFRGSNLYATRKYPRPPIAGNPRAFALWRQIRNELYRALAHPVTVHNYADQQRHEVQVLDFLRYVMDSNVRRFFVEVLQLDGSWEHMTNDFDILRPLLTDGWIRSYLNRWERDIAYISRAYNCNVKDDVTNWLCDCIRLEMCWNRLMPALRKQIQQCFQLQPEAVDIARSLLLPRESASLYASHYCRIWRRLEMWQRVFRETPTLAPVLHAALEDNQIFVPNHEEPISILKRYLHKEGISKRGWKLLCHLGRAVYWPSVSRRMRYGPSVALVDHLRLLQGCKDDAMPSLEFQRTLYIENTIMDLSNIPPRLIELANEQFNRHKVQGSTCDFVNEQWLPLLSWFQRSSPQLTKAQWRGGWVTLLKIHRRSVDVREDILGPLDWEIPLPYFSEENLEAIPICSRTALELEAELMANCVCDYAGECEEGRTHFFSIRDRNIGSRIATLQLGKVMGSWEVAQVKRIANQSAGSSIRQFSHRVATAFNDAVGKGSDRTARSGRALQQEFCYE